MKNKRVCASLTLTELFCLLLFLTLIGVGKEKDKSLLTHVRALINNKDTTAVDVIQLKTNIKKENHARNKCVFFLMFIMGVGNHNNCKSEKVGGVEAVLGATFIFYLCNLFMGAVLTKLI